jgi:C4-dicarboxylate-specific signal transduction histidine kinase
MSFGDSFPDDPYIAISVFDDGPGVSGIDSKRLFQLGFTTKRDEGHGIGLALAQLERFSRDRSGVAAMVYIVDRILWHYG